ncbi:hypothetical protein BN2475_140036 [Paraburkholderia ribeironis]|uniref:Uncharacterized protein n=1 Tax=Paraburkholderia ribeironis TaxID=1247936 RepID=A0A1N7RSS2_9BURK|nr:hypothetical protein BN2475_140036 [Paraburkholderia ribeironis]
MMGFEDFRCARIIRSGIQIMHMIRKGQMKDGDTDRTVATRFYSLAMSVIPIVTVLTRPDSTIAARPFLCGGRRGRNFLFYEHMGSTDFIWVEEQGRIQIPTGFAFAHQVCHAPCHRDSKTGARSTRPTAANCRF